MASLPAPARPSLLHRAIVSSATLRYNHLLSGPSIWAWSYRSLFSRIMYLWLSSSDWFRLTKPAASHVSDDLGRLRIVCLQRTVATKYLAESTCVPVPGPVPVHSEHAHTLLLAAHTCLARCACAGQKSLFYRAGAVNALAAPSEAHALEKALTWLASGPRTTL